tara:strand:+ start:2544 stop:2786 length:243 start_codon:yes stop_codon:yes gene_type:complete
MYNMEYLGDYERQLFAEIGIDYTQLNREQIETILIPDHAPENYYQDGEISTDQAEYLHSQRLIQCGIVGDLYNKAMKLTK